MIYFGNKKNDINTSGRVICLIHFTVYKQSSLFQTTLNIRCLVATIANVILPNA